MSDIKKYELKEYIPGKTSFEVSLGDIFVVPNNEVLKSIDYVSVSNNGIIQCKKEGSGTTTKFIFTSTSNVKEPNHKYDVTVKFTLTTEINTDEATASVKTRNCFIKLILTPEINDTTSKLHIINYMGKLSPDEYIKEHRDKDDLDSLVTKKGLITNLKEFGKQVQNKVSNVQVFAIRYDLDGGSWDNGNEGRTSFVNSIAYVAPRPVKLGYTFNGWKIYKIADDSHSQRLNENISVDSMIPVGTNYDTLCVANWIRNNYKVTCYNASNEPIFSPSIEYNENATLLEASVDDTNIILPIKAGHTLDYWTTTDKFGQVITCKSDQNLNNVYDQIFDASNENIDRHIYLKPHFEPNVYKLNYILDGGNLDGSDDTINTYKYGTTFTLPIPRRNGYKFNGWTIGNLVNQFVINPTDLEDITTSTVEVKASWVAAAFHLDFDLQGGIIANNSNYTLKANTAIILSNPTRPGYTFGGWEYDKADGQITLDNTTKKYTFTPADTIDHDVTLKALWSESDTTSFELQTWEETPESTGIFTDAYNDTCSYRLIKSETASGRTGDETTFSDVLYPENYQIPKGFSLSRIENAIIKGDGSSIVRIYIHRNICNVKIVDKYESTENSSSSNITYTNLYRTSLNKTGSTTESAISCKFGQTITVYPLFNNTYPANGYSCNSTGKTVIISGNDTIELTYRKKLIKITFDLNNVGTWTINSNAINSDIYSIDIPYNTKLDSIHIPDVTNYNDVNNSKWVIEPTNADINNYSFTKDTKIRRIPTFYSNKVIIETENYDENSFGITNVMNQDYYTTNSNNYYLSSSIRPIKLLTPALDAYNFIGYKYKFDENGNFSDNYITSIYRDIWTATNASSDLHIKACFERKEPTLDLSSVIVTYSNGTLNVQKVALKSGATKFYISSTIPNANVNTNLGNGSELSNDNVTYTASISGSFSADKNHNTIVLIPSKEVGIVKITGKPFIGTISSIDSTTVSVSWIQSYQVYDNQDEATLTNVNFKTNGALSDNKDTTLNISADADKVAITNDVISIINKNSDTLNYNIDNFDGEEHTIQITPIIYNKSGKSAFITYKQSTESVNENALSNGNNIIELENQKSTYYIKNDMNLTSGTEAVKDKTLIDNSAYTYADTINLSSTNNVSSLALGKPASKLKNYYIDIISVKLLNLIKIGNNYYKVADNNNRTVSFYVGNGASPSFILKSGTIGLMKSTSGSANYSSTVQYTPSISNNNLILTNKSDSDDKITLSLSDEDNQVDSVTCTISNTSTVNNITKYYITSTSNGPDTDENSSITIDNAAYTTSGAITSITLGYTAKKYTYSLINATSGLADYTKIQNVVNTALNSVIDNSKNKESGTYIDSSFNFTTNNNIVNTSNIIMPNNLTVELTPYNSTGTSFNTTVTYNYSNVQETITKYKSEIINKIL